MGIDARGSHPHPRLSPPSPRLRSRPGPIVSGRVGQAATRPPAGGPPGRATPCPLAVCPPDGHYSERGAAPGGSWPADASPVVLDGRSAHPAGHLAAGDLIRALDSPTAGSRCPASSARAGHAAQHRAFVRRSAHPAGTRTSPIPWDLGRPVGTRNAGDPPPNLLLQVALALRGPAQQLARLRQVMSWSGSVHRLEPRWQAGWPAIPGLRPSGTGRRRRSCPRSAPRTPPSVARTGWARPAWPPGGWAP